MIRTNVEIKISKDAFFRELRGEAVILNVDSGIYFGLDETATRLWELIEKHRTIDAVVEAMLLEYEVEEGVVRKDVEEFVGKLAEENLIAMEEPVAAP